MATTENSSLFTVLTVEESATVCGGVGVITVLSSQSLTPPTLDQLIALAESIGLTSQYVTSLQQELTAANQSNT